MITCHYCGDPVPALPQELKMDTIGRWMESNWIEQRAELDYLLVNSQSCVTHRMALQKFAPQFELEGGYAFLGTERFEHPEIARITNYTYRGYQTCQTGASVYRFSQPGQEEIVEVLVVCSYYTDASDLLTLAAMPESFLASWVAFTKECDRLINSLEPDEDVVIIGGRGKSFSPTTDWDDIILPDELKAELVGDVKSFFTKGVEVYKRLKLKPFRKLLLAGVPGTGKTMLCSALAKWAISQNYLVVYVSSGDGSGSTFSKIEHALQIAADSKQPTLILLEELDAYLNEKEKALVLNILDGSESSINEKGTQLVATTN